MWDALGHILLAGTVHGFEFLKFAEVLHLSGLLFLVVLDFLLSFNHTLVSVSSFSSNTCILHIPLCSGIDHQDTGIDELTPALIDHV